MGTFNRCHKKILDSCATKWYQCVGSQCNYNNQMIDFSMDEDTVIKYTKRYLSVVYKYYSVLHLNYQSRITLLLRIAAVGIKST